MIPRAECLKDTLERTLPYWEDAIVPDLRAGRVVLVAAHGNSLRALVKHLDGISDDAITELNIPTGNPLVYELDDTLTPVSSGYLDPEAAAAGAAEVAAQAGELDTSSLPTASLEQVAAGSHGSDGEAERRDPPAQPQHVDVERVASRCAFRPAGRSERVATHHRPVAGQQTRP